MSHEHHKRRAGKAQIQLTQQPLANPEAPTRILPPKPSLDKSGRRRDDQSWEVNGMAQVAMHDAQEKDYKCDQWKNGDVIGLACDLDKMQVHVSLIGHVSLRLCGTHTTKGTGKSLEIVFIVVSECRVRLILGRTHVLDCVLERRKHLAADRARSAHSMMILALFVSRRRPRSALA